ncbi:MAG: response regulator transcription factor [Gammaproteobacteria bacterium]|nr:response regulator transcription factor [Gammaproteobacteria bacterium]
MKILLVDDDADLRALIHFALSRDGLLVVEANNVAAGLRKFDKERPDLVILDINLPDGDGLQLCQQLRSKTNVPILMLTVRNSEDDLVQALELGADDFLSKPFSPRTLLARVKALMRRSTLESSAQTHGQFSLDHALRQLSIGQDATMRLTAMETRLMQILLAHQGKPVSSDRIIQYVWGTRLTSDRQKLKQLIHRLRQKIEADPTAPEWLLTEPGIGYRLKVSEDKSQT